MDLAGRLGTTSAAELVSALLESLGDALYIVDGAGDVLYANRVALEVLGFTHEEDLLGRPSHETIHHTRPDGTPFPKDECPLLRPPRDGVTVHVEDDWFVRADGTLVPVAYSSAPLALPGGRGAVVVFRDVTARLRLERSRSRIVAAADEERRRLSRDLHDGAQQRLVGVGLNLDLALHGDDVPDAIREAVQTARGEVTAAVEDLRRLARGLHPSILEHRGLRAAISSLTANAPLPVELDVTDERFPAPVEAAAYFLVAEALANVHKHAQANAVRVTVRAADARLHVDVTDDGAGGATERVGGGLAGLRDRFAALGGELAVESAPYRGTTVRAALPVGASSGQ